MRRLLVLNFFPAFQPPRSGGELRYHRFYSALSKFYDVTLLSPTYPEHPYEVVDFNRRFREHRVPKTTLHVKLHQTLDREEIGPECSGLVCALASDAEDAFRTHLRELAADADMIIHSSPFLLNYDEGFRRDGKPRVYESYNVEAQLALQLFRRPQADKYIRFIADLERQLVEGSDLVLATSETERDVFRRLYGCPSEKLALAPNGVDPDPQVEEVGSRSECRNALGLAAQVPCATFLGSAHPPNVDAARYVCERLAPALPRVQFAIAGAVCRQITTRVGNVRLMGVISDADKTKLFHACEAALNPVLSGAGTNLKMLDYMAAGLAVVTTPFGVRGLPVEPERHCLVRELDDFPGAVEALLRDPNRRAALGQAAAGLVRARFSWDAIADRVRESLERLLDKRDGSMPRKRILLLNDFPVASRAHGGQVRISELFTRLSRRYEVTLLCLTSERFTTEVPITHSFRELRVPKTVAHRRTEAEWRSQHAVSTDDILSSLVCRENPALVAEYRRLARYSDAIILLHPYLAPLLEAAPRKAPVVYEALNVERTLKARILTDHPDRKRLLHRVAEMETLACKLADQIVCVSEEDRREFARSVDAQKLNVVPNGVDVGAYATEMDLGPARKLFRGRPVTVFLGSGHPPNVEAVEFISSVLAPRHPNVCFLVIGSSCDPFRQRKLPANVLLCGTVATREKEALLQLADVALNPMFSGGGSSLKVAEYLAAGLPLLSTPIGLRGFDLRPGSEALVTEAESFSDQLAALLADNDLRQTLAGNGREHAKRHLDWSGLATTYERLIENLRSQRPRRLLVTTFRFTDPPRGGAETYLMELLRRMHATGRFSIDVATFDVGEITTSCHFSAIYEPGQPAHPPFVERLHGFHPEALPIRSVRQGCRRLFRVWLEEDLMHARGFLDRFNEPVLLGGWYPPEKSVTKTSRWTGPEAEIYVSEGVRSLAIAGFAKGRTAATFSFAGRQLHADRLNGAFSIDLPLGDHAAGILRIEAQATQRGRGDPRMLGICVSEIQQSDGTNRRILPLTRDFGAYMRSIDPAAWISSLTAITKKRARSDDGLFLQVRGPNSRRFEQWLETELASYDLVLAHGTPFSHVAVTARAASRARMPLVVLPHYHADDKYYHWRHYYDAFTAADLVLAAPDLAKERFFDPLGATSVCVPGGVDPTEFDALESCMRSFRELHSSTKPFVLVLGRKTGAKQYGRVLHAVDLVRAQYGDACELVLIGPDEDGVPISQPWVAYYGVQPRQIVLGALGSCLCLATMSESESFGIVLTEAWMCGKPVVANRTCPAFAELVTDGRDGLLCGSDEEIADAIGRLCSQPELADRLGARGREKTLERFTWERIGLAVTELLSSILEDAGHLPSRQSAG